MPLEQRHAQRGGDLLGELGLAGTRFALYQQRAAEGDGSIDRQGEVVGRNIGAGAVKAHGGYRMGGEWAL